MGTLYPVEVVEEARTLYVENSMTLERIGLRLGITTSTLSRWSQEESWDDQRQEYRKTLQSFHAKFHKIRRKAIEKLEATEDITSQDIFAFVQLERLADARKKKDSDHIDKDALFMEHLEFILSVLKEDSAALKIFQSHFDRIITAYKEKAKK